MQKKLVIGNVTFPVNQEIFIDILAFAGLFLEFLFEHTRIGQIGFLMVAAAGAICIITHVPFKIKSCGFIVLYMILALYFQMRIVQGYSFNPTLSSSYVSTMLKCLIYMFFAYQYISRRSLNQMTNFFAIFGVLLSVYLALTGALFSGDRFGEIGINSNSIGILLAVCVSLLGYRVLDKMAKHKVTDIALMVLFVVVIFLSGSRKALFLCAVPFVFYYTFQNMRKAFWRIIVALVVLIAAYYTIMRVEYLYNIIGVRVEAILTWFNTGETLDGSMNSRVDYVRLGMTWFRQYPWRGIGLFCFSELKGAKGTYSHNNFVELLVSGGIPALVLFYLPFLLSIIRAWRLGLHSEKQRFLFFLLLCCVVSHIGMVMYFTRMMLFISLVLFSLIQRGDKETEVVQTCQ